MLRIRCTVCGLTPQQREAPAYEWGERQDVILSLTSMLRAGYTDIRSLVCLLRSAGSGALAAQCSFPCCRNHFSLHRQLRFKLVLRLSALT